MRQITAAPPSAVAEQFASAAGDNAGPTVRVFGEGLALEGVDLVANTTGDGHGTVQLVMPERWLTTRGLTIRP